MSIITKLRIKFTKKKTQRITITFVERADGTVQTFTKMDNRILVGYAATALDRLKAQISVGLAKRVVEAGYTPKNPKRRQFIRQQTLGDILK